MTPRQETIHKWGLYALATLLCCVGQGLVLQYVTVLGVFPFIYPILAAVVSTLEGPLSGMVYSLALGVVCDLTISSPIPCFYTLIFPLSGLGRDGLRLRAGAGAVHSFGSARLLSVSACLAQEP